MAQMVVVHTAHHFLMEQMLRGITTPAGRLTAALIDWAARLWLWKRRLRKRSQDPNPQQRRPAAFDGRAAVAAAAIGVCALHYDMTVAAEYEIGRLP